MSIQRKILFMLCAAALMAPNAFAQTSGVEKSMPDEEKSSLPFGWVFGLSAPLADNPSSDTLAASLLWRIAPGAWSAEFSARTLDPDGDGENLNLSALDALMEQVREANAPVAPVLDQADLQLLGYSSLDQQTPSARWKFLSALAARYASKESKTEAGTVAQWQMKIDILGAEGVNPKDAQQLVLDAMALSDPTGRAAMVAEIGEFSAETTDEEKAAITAFSQSALRSTLIGISLGYKVSQPNFAHETEGIQRLRASAYLLPMSIHSIKPTAEFSQKASDLPEKTNWTAEKTEACYLSALGAYCAATLPGGTFFWDDSASTTTASTRPGEISPAVAAAKRLTSLMKPYFKSRADGEDHVWVMTYSRISAPPSYVVFWDWAVEPDVSVKEFHVPVPQQTYRITPLVDDPPLWDGAKIMDAGKEGLPLQLGRTPLYIEIENPGRGISVPIGLTEQQYRTYTGKNTPATQTTDDDAKHE